jgi:hypothetical protein
MTKIISRSEAKAAGLKRYFTGKPCKYGHVTERQVSSGRCMRCDVLKNAASPEENRQNAHAWRIANPKKCRENRRAWRKANPDKCKELDAANPEKRRERALARRWSNIETVRERDRLNQRKIRARKYCDKIATTIEQGAASSATSGVLLDIDTALEIFKCDDAAFELAQEGPGEIIFDPVHGLVTMNHGTRSEK